MHRGLRVSGGVLGAPCGRNVRELGILRREKCRFRTKPAQRGLTILHHSVFRSYCGLAALV